jgi:hypothetical protein
VLKPFRIITFFYREVKSKRMFLTKFIYFPQSLRLLTYRVGVAVGVRVGAGVNVGVAMTAEVLGEYDSV